jgi:hypothetical protein
MNLSLDYFWHRVAWRLPQRLVYWAAIRLIAHATSGKWRDTEAPVLAAMEALGRWESQSQGPQ